MKRVFLDQDEFVIGADPSADLYLPFSGIEDFHAMIRLRNGKYAIQPVSNGSLTINGCGVGESRILKEGDSIQIPQATIELARRTPEDRPLEALWISKL